MSFTTHKKVQRFKFDSLTTSTKTASDTVVVVVVVFAVVVVVVVFAVVVFNAELFNDWFGC